MIDFGQFKFRYEFRNYQKRALDEVHRYMEDDKIHIVAAPGAGKTILALQLLVEIEKNTLILVPTIALREQWIERFGEDFANGQSISKFISNDITDVKPITVVTYQSLHSACKDSEATVCDILKEQKVGLIILDEAHHLKESWCRTLEKVLESIKGVKVISLTATPPYDVSNHEWKKYIELCGEIDTEITIPELVKEDSLCPHQDYVYFNFPTNKQLCAIEKYREERNKIFTELCESNEFVTAISLHPGIINLDEHIDYFLNNFDYYISMLSFLEYRGVSITERVAKKEIKIPNFNLKYMEILLTKCLFTDKNSYKDFADYFKDIKRKLNEVGAIQESKVQLLDNKETKLLITQNIGKLNSINEIISNEYEFMQNKLKMVVVTDYIREDIYEIQEDAEVNAIGAIPIFKSIRDKLEDKVSIAVLTGRIVIVPTNMREALITICNKRGITEIEATELAYDFDYCKVAFSEKVKKYMVSIITELFEKNDVQVLIGTGALIGEGWDAPFVNTLIMATFISSFVTSNQIRGRAIRTNKNDKDKVANVWHLVCLEQVEGKNNEKEYNFGVDYDVLKRRFKTFEGVCIEDDAHVQEEALIDTGIARLGIDDKSGWSHDGIVSVNAEMAKAASERSRVNEIWQEALENYVPIKRCKIARADCNENVYKQFKAETTRVLVTVVAILVLSGICFTAFLVWKNVIVALAAMGLIAGLAIQSGHRVRHHYLVIKFARAVLSTLVEIAIIERVSKIIVQQKTDEVNFHMTEGSTVERARYNACLKEMLSPIENPRYLVKIKRGYYQVPAVIGKNKKGVQILEKYLRKEFLRVGLLYTKTPVGKWQLLEIKMQSIVK